MRATVGEGPRRCSAPHAIAIVRISIAHPMHRRVQPSNGAFPLPSTLGSERAPPKFVPSSPIPSETVTSIG